MPQLVLPVPQRARRPLAALLLLVVVAGLSLLATKHSLDGDLEPVCHPTISRLASDDGKEVVLIGIVPVDLDRAADELVRGAVRKMSPDVIMLEGVPQAGITAMVVAGKWELFGAPNPSNFDWKDIGDAQPVDIPKPKRRGFLSFSNGGRVAQSLVPVKVDNWAFHLRHSVGTGISSALTAAALHDIPVLYLGPTDGGMQGHNRVAMLAQQAVLELLEDEHQRGSPMPLDEVDTALERAEGHVRDEAERWLQDARGQNAAFERQMNEGQIPPQMKKNVEVLRQHLEERAQGLAERVAASMEGRSRGILVLGVEQLVAVEGKLLNSGYSYVSDCA